MTNQRTLLRTVALAAVVLTALPLAGCATDDTAGDDQLDFVEPPLTTDEIAVLPNVPDPDHTEATMVAGPAEDDAANFDDDEVVAPADVEEIDDAPTAAPISSAAVLAWGLHPRASDALRAAGVSAWRITQTIGDAADSAGYHHQDGTFNGHPYSAATDISVSSLSSTQIHNLLEKLGKLGFAVWYRKNGVDGWSGANHMHAVYANCKMKTQLQAQVRAFLVRRNGLVSNTIYTWHHFSSAALTAVKHKFERSAHGTTNGGGGVSGRINTAGAPLTIRAGTSTSTASIGSVADGTYVSIHCQAHGQTISGTYGTTNLWDKIGTGYVSDAYVATGSDGQVAPTCP